MSKILIDEASANQPQAVPLHEQLASVPANARLVVESEDGTGTLFIPVGRLCQEAAAALRQALEQSASETWWDNIPNTPDDPNFVRGESWVGQ